MFEGKRCCGCGACVSSCPTNAIRMIQDDEGFITSEIDFQKCIYCGKCEQVCPLASPPHFIHHCYALYNKNEKIRSDSSSGGVFSLLAEEILNRQGYVCGASYTSKKGCHHIIINDISDLEKLRGSKYIQSYIGDTYIQTKKLLDNGKWVLYSGTPCQIAGLKNYLGKDYKYLLTVDLICHGTPSSKVWNAYLKDNFPDEKIQRVNFRSKKTGWKNYSICIDTDKQKYQSPYLSNAFMKGFLDDVYLNESCYLCPFHRIQRVADITLGDFWGLNVIDAELDNDKGMNLVLLNSLKAYFFLNSIQKDNYFLKEYPIEKVLPFNAPLSSSPFKKYNSKLFFKLLKDVGFNRALERTRDKKKNVALLNLFYTRNYGAILTAYALQTVLLHLDYNPCLIKKTYQLSTKDFLDPFYTFETENLYTTDDILHPVFLNFLNESYDKFIVGSDQVWRFEYTGDDYKSYFLSFVAKEKKKIAYAASFGLDHWDGPERIRQEVQEYLKNFTAISVREKNGVNVCRNTFSVEAKALFDPVFLLSQEDWNNILQKTNIDLSSSCVVYILDRTPETETLLESLSKRFSLFNLNDKMSVYDFLKSIQTAKQIVTDSFHGLCFSIIFQKDFLCLCNENRGGDRFTSLLSDLKLMDRLFYKAEDICWDKLAPINYTRVNAIIEQKRQEGIAFLKQSLAD